MCGRFNLVRPEDIVARFGFMDWSEKRIEPRFNIAPSQEILTIVQLPLDTPIAQTATWGLKPFWLDKGKPPPINARAEAASQQTRQRRAVGRDSHSEAQRADGDDPHADARDSASRTRADLAESR